MKAAGQCFSTIALVGRHNTPGIAEPLSRLAQFLAARGRSVVLEAQTASEAPLGAYATAEGCELGARADLVIVIGGDGTMLSVGRQLARFDVPLIGINQGRLGFLTDIALDEMEQTLESMLRGAALTPAPP